MSSTNELIDAKRKLYLLLMKINPVENMTDTEVEIMYQLSKDEDIQNILTNGK